jgi:hypothetical protein
MPHVQNRDVIDACISTGRGAYHHIHIEMFLVHGV